jgi:hypothetical protein
VVVHNNDIDPARFDFADSVGSRSAAIERHEKPRRTGRQASLNSFFGESITFFQPVRQKRANICPKRLQNAKEQGNRGYSINVIVSVKNDLLPSIKGEEDTVYSRANTRNLKGIAQIAQPREQELPRGSFLIQPHPSEDRSECR